MGGIGVSTIRPYHVRISSIFSGFAHSFLNFSPLKYGFQLITRLPKKNWDLELHNASFPAHNSLITTYFGHFEVFSIFKFFNLYIHISTYNHWNFNFWGRQIIRDVETYLTLHSWAITLELTLVSSIFGDQKGGSTLLPGRIYFCPPGVSTLSPGGSLVLSVSVSIKCLTIQTHDS